MLDKENVYLLGIGGIGMSALARYFATLGRSVAGYDRSPSPLCRRLEQEGMHIHYQADPALIPRSFTPENTLVIYTPALDPEHSEILALREGGFSLFKRAAVLGAISALHRCLAIAGTHGKTSTSTLLAHLLRHSGQPALAFLGGLSTNYQSNFWGQVNAEWMVVEADEFDRSFRHLAVEAAVVTSMDPDHLDIYGEARALEESFRHFAQAAQSAVVYQESLTALPGKAYGWQPSSSYRAENLRVVEHQYRFDYVSPRGRIEDLICTMPGKHNVENAVAALALAEYAGLNVDQIRSGMESFRGVKRRFEYHINTNHTVYIDDYAHHPREIEALAGAIAELYPQKRKLVIFQPHLYSRTRDFQTEFGRALSLFDQVILLDIYPARERPIAGISSKNILDALTVPAQILSREEALNQIKQSKPELLISAGAGDIDQMVQSIKMALLQ